MRRKININIEDILNIENNFYELDEENKIAYLNLEFTSPDEIFDKNSITKIPVVSDDFLSWIDSSLEYTQKKYKVNINVWFDDLNGYTEEELNDIFMKNMILEFKKNEREKISKDRIAYSLIGIGVLFLIITLLITGLWNEKTLFREIITYILDIATTVVIWEALNILIVENRENKSYLRNTMMRFKSITFHKKSDK